MIKMKRLTHSASDSAACAKTLAESASPAHNPDKSLADNIDWFRWLQTFLPHSSGMPAAFAVLASWSAVAALGSAGDVGMVGGVCRGVVGVGCRGVFGVGCLGCVVPSPIWVDVVSVVVVVVVVEVVVV